MHRHHARGPWLVSGSCARIILLAAAATFPAAPAMWTSADPHP